MTLQLYLDDCAFDRDLRRELRADGHEVTIPADVGLTGEDDDVHFTVARERGFVLLTLNPEDFESLHRQNPDHPGLLLVYQDNDRRRDMSVRDIARAIRNLLAAGVEIAGETHILNHWRY